MQSCKQSFWACAERSGHVLCVLGVYQACTMHARCVSVACAFWACAKRCLQFPRQWAALERPACETASFMPQRLWSAGLQCFAAPQHLWPKIGRPCHLIPCSAQAHMPGQSTALDSHGPNCLARAQPDFRAWPEHSPGLPRAQLPGQSTALDFEPWTTPSKSRWNARAPCPCQPTCGYRHCKSEQEHSAHTAPGPQAPACLRTCRRAPRSARCPSAARQPAAGTRGPAGHD